MSLDGQLRRLLIRVLLPICIASNVYLYAYPAFLGCSFPTPNSSNEDGHPNAAVAPFRLLTLADPQIEGDSSLPDFIQRESLSGLWHASSYLKALRKRLDLVGNDYYLAHIYRTLHWWTEPTHVTVLGDLLGSQWLSDAEFERRGWRFWSRIFRHGEKVEDEIAAASATEVLGRNTQWERKIINIPGNHDIGYAGDMVAPRIERFERLFGRVNWFIRFQLPGNGSSHTPSEHKDNPPELRIVVLNSLNLDGPVIDSALQQQTYDFVNHAITTSRPVEDKSASTLLLTHLPLHKDAGLCVDGPFIAYNDPEYGGGVKEQNHLGYQTGKGILEGIFGMSGNPDAPGGGMGRPGIILTGHDHEGCDVHHFLPQASAEEGYDKRGWRARLWSDGERAANTSSLPGIREITVRSMMGDYGGNAGLLSAWYDSVHGGWHFEYSACQLGVQHIWWAVHVADLLTLFLAVALVPGWLRHRSWSNRRELDDCQSQRTSEESPLKPSCDSDALVSEKPMISGASQPSIF